MCDEGLAKAHALCNYTRHPVLVESILLVLAEAISTSYKRHSVWPVRRCICLLYNGTDKLNMEWQCQTLNAGINFIWIQVQTLLMLGFWDFRCTKLLAILEIPVYIFDIVKASKHTSVFDCNKLL